MLEREKC